MKITGGGGYSPEGRGGFGGSEPGRQRISGIIKGFARRALLGEGVQSQGAAYKQLGERMYNDAIRNIAEGNEQRGLTKMQTAANLYLQGSSYLEHGKDSNSSKRQIAVRGRHLRTTLRKTARTENEIGNLLKVADERESEKLLQGAKRKMSEAAGYHKRYGKPGSIERYKQRYGKSPFDIE